MKNMDNPALVPCVDMLQKEARSSNVKYNEKRTQKPVAMYHIACPSGRTYNRPAMCSHEVCLDSQDLLYGLSDNFAHVVNTMDGNDEILRILENRS